MNRNGQKLTESDKKDRNLQIKTETKRSGQKETEAIRNRKKPSEN